MTCAVVTSHPLLHYCRWTVTTPGYVLCGAAAANDDDEDYNAPAPAGPHALPLEDVKTQLVLRLHCCVYFAL
jgi:hypothetical protein